VEIKLTRKSDIDEILRRLDKIEDELRGIKGTQNLSNNPKPVFHSLSVTDKIEEKRFQHREDSEGALDTAADAIIQHYRLEPPKRTGGT